MKTYLKKYWKINLSVAVFLTIGVILSIAHQFIITWMTQELINQNFEKFLIALLTIILIFLIQNIRSYICTKLKSTAIRRMNNQVRQDMASRLLHRNYSEFHSQESGQYLSWFTNDINQIETLGWNSFFEIITAAVQVVLAMVALAYLHWSLLVLSLVTTALMMPMPKLFSKKMENVGQACSKHQEEGVSRLKDLLSGYDVLSFFGKGSRFESGVAKESDYIEEQKYNLICTQTLWGNVMDFTSIICLMAIIGLIGLLSVNGVFSAAVIMSGGGSTIKIFMFLF